MLSRRECTSWRVHHLVRCLSLSPLLSAPVASAAWGPTLISKRGAVPASLATSSEGDVLMAEAQDWLAQHSFRPLPPADYQQHNTEFAMRARQELPAAASVPKDLFLNQVLPYQHFDEPLDDWRPDFFQRLTAEPSIRNAGTLKELAETVIPLTFTSLGNQVAFKSNMTPQAMAPISETIKFGHASCTGLSILVANALRSVGVPARVAGVAEWNRESKGNHNWVEVWTGDGWHFIDAVPMTKVNWDQAWFTADGTVQKSLANTISAVSSPEWDAHNADTNYTVGWRTPSVLLPAIDRTAFYKAIPSQVSS